MVLTKPSQSTIMEYDKSAFKMVMILFVFFMNLTPYNDISRIFIVFFAVLKHWS